MLDERDVCSYVMILVLVWYQLSINTFKCLSKGFQFFKYTSKVWIFEKWFCLSIPFMFICHAKKNPKFSYMGKSS